MPRAVAKAPLFLSLALALTLAGCSKLQARIEMKRGNELYLQEQYSEALAQFQKGLQLDPSFKAAWRSVGLSAMAQFRPEDDSPENIQVGKTAIDAFQKYLEAFPNDEKVRDYLLTTLINTKQYDRALEYLKGQQAKRPTDKIIDQGIVTILTRQGKLQEAFNWAQSHASKDVPQVYHSIAALAWDQSYNRASELTPEDHAAVVELGLKAEGIALKLDPKYFEAMTYLNLLYREQAKLEPDPFKAQELYAKADELLKQALALREAAAKAAAQQAAAAGN